MKIPIFNTLYSDRSKPFKSKILNLENLNDLKFKSIDAKKFPSIKILDFLPEKNSLFETVLVSVNDELVKLFLQNKITFIEIVRKIFSFVKNSEFDKFKKNNLKMPMKSLN